VVTCSKKDNAELFNSMAGSQGTLGLVALVGVECEEAGEVTNREEAREEGKERGQEDERKREPMQHCSIV